MSSAPRRRLAALGFGAGLLVCAELALRLSPWAPPTREEWNRQNGVISIEHYFAQQAAHVVERGSDEGGAWCGPPEALTATGDPYQDAMEPARWRCDKPAGTFRVVMLGESSVQGFGLQEGETLPDQLGVALAGRSRPIEVINLGVAGYNSLQIVRMLPEIWRLSPDLLVYYGGHNDFTYYPVVEAALAARPSLVAARELSDQVALVRLVRTGAVALGALPAPPPIPPGRQAPLAVPTRSEKSAFNQPPIPEPTSREAHREMVLQQQKAGVNIRAFFEANMREIDAAAEAHGVPFVMVTPVCQLDGIIGRSIHWRWLEPDARRAWDEAWPAVAMGVPRPADPHLARLFELDPTFADLQTAAGRQAQAAGKPAEALVHFKSGLDLMAPTRSDRAPWSFGDDMLGVGAELDVPTLDLRPTFEATIVNPPPAPRDLFLDVLHFNPAGARLVADRIAAFLDAQALVPAR